MTTPDAPEKPGPDAWAILALAAARLIEIFLPLLPKKDRE